MNKHSNLPDRFPMSSLSDFNFGSPDGKDDPLLEACALKITPISEFLEENKSIVVGERGSGKTAIFRLLSDGKLAFKSTEKFSQIYVPIDEDLAYKTLREHVSFQVKDKTKSPEIPHRIVWEIYFFSRCVDALSKEFPDDKKISSIKNNFYQAAGLPQQKTFRLIDIFTSSKKTVGVKLEGGHLGFLVPNFYTSVEPSINSGDIDDVSFLDIPSLKAEMNNYLKISKKYVYVLVDKLDEFVSGDDYLTQMLILQSLTQCWRDYQSYPHIKIKLFLRPDLYERLDFSFGRDKIDPKKVDLNWSEEDIRHFVAYRIMHNIIPAIGKRNIKFKIDKKSLTIDKQFLKEISSIDSTPDHEITWIRGLRQIYLRVRSYIKTRKRDAYDARTVSTNDAVFRSLITLLFPRKVIHRNKFGKEEQIELMSYFSSHLHFASGHATPRVLIIFLQKCLENSRAYYRNNFDIDVFKNEKDEYPLFLREHISNAYDDIRVLCLTTVLGLNGDFQKPATALLQYMNKTKSFEKISFNEAKKILFKSSPELFKDDNDIRRFFAFYEHSGLFKCSNRMQESGVRFYELPILFQKVDLRK